MSLRELYIDEQSGEYFVGDEVATFKTYAQRVGNLYRNLKKGRLTKGLPAAGNAKGSLVTQKQAKEYAKARRLRGSAKGSQKALPPASSKRDNRLRNAAIGVGAVGVGAEGVRRSRKKKRRRLFGR